MDRFVAKLNIEHFKRLIAKAHDDTELQKLHRLLAAEEMILERSVTGPWDGKREG